MKKLLTIFSIGIIFFSTSPRIALADLAGLVPCYQSATYTKKLTTSVTKLENKLKKYEVGSPPSLAIEQQIQRTKQRFDRYAKSGLLCGTDGLPHLITDGRWSHAAEFSIPAILFLYITGWIGWVGRKYLRTVSSDSNSTEKEIIIDVPLALSIMTSGFSWPVSAWQEFTSGDLLNKAEDITISPR
uniref:photosystem I subunit III n=1 Tax=Vacuolaria virescens TaxID=44451 RepID=UPI002114C840|nr:photosystem I subunit III [Vacuolaria virescens]UTE94656.1 photosystem I subunit III [Vacuolaria virescens]